MPCGEDISKVIMDAEGVWHLAFQCGSVTGWASRCKQAQVTEGKECQARFVLNSQTLGNAEKF